MARDESLWKDGHPTVQALLAWSGTDAEQRDGNFLSDYPHLSREDMAAIDEHLDTCMWHMGSVCGANLENTRLVAEGELLIV